MSRFFDDAGRVDPTKCTEIFHSAASNVKLYIPNDSPLNCVLAFKPPPPPEASQTQQYLVLAQVIRSKFVVSVQDAGLCSIDNQFGCYLIMEFCGSASEPSDLRTFLTNFQRNSDGYLPVCSSSLWN